MGIFDRLKDTFGSGDDEDQAAEPAEAPPSATSAVGGAHAAPHLDKDEREAARVQRQEAREQARTQRQEAREETRHEARHADRPEARPGAGLGIGLGIGAGIGPVVEDARQAARHAAREFETCTVLDGDTLSDVAVRHGVAWHELVRLNNLENPDLIVPGQELRIPRR